MKIAIHHSRDSFSTRWIEYCEKQQIPYKVVNAYDNSIIEQLKDCSALMWHFHHFSSKDIIMAKPLLFSLHQMGFPVFPDFNTAWHFDDKVGQKYLMEALQIAVPSTWIFYSKKEAMKWVAKTDFPKVFKLRGGAGSQNVRLVKNERSAIKLVRQAFGTGFANYDGRSSLKERIRKYRIGQGELKEIAEGLIRLLIPPHYAKVMGRETDYIYYQEFIPGNDSDIRVIVIDGKAFAIKRMVRKHDFRASGSGFLQHDKVAIDEHCITLSFDYARRLKSQCVAFDYVFGVRNEPLLVEISYGFSIPGYEACPGFWDEQMNWNEGHFDPYGWMVELIRKSVNEKS